MTRQLAVVAVKKVVDFLEGCEYEVQKQDLMKTLLKVMAANAPITVQKALTLTSIGISPQFVTFTHVIIDSDKYICVRTTSPQNHCTDPSSRVLALKAQIPGTTLDHLQIFNIELKSKVKTHQMPEQVVFWKWVTPSKVYVIFLLVVVKLGTPNTYLPGTNWMIKVDGMCLPAEEPLDNVCHETDLRPSNETLILDLSFIAYHLGLAFTFAVFTCRSAAPLFIIHF